MFGFLLKNAVNNVTERIDSLGDKVDILVEKFAASAVKNEHNTEEIKALRHRMHDLSNIVAEVKIIQDRCKACAKP
jgi:peptidoglycan hydrolase CwlO-like protein